MNSRIINGQIIYGINNIYTVYSLGINYECRIKGKVLKDTDGFYNPLTAGDIVEIEINEEERQGKILSLIERKNVFTRWNRKRMSLQLIASNIDFLFCITTPEKPPFRPRFIDRVLISAGDSFKTAVIINKTDLGVDTDIKNRLAYYEKNNVDIYYCSALEKKGLDKIREIVNNNYCAFVGQSGVGKSTLINTLSEFSRQKTGEISNKYNRGRHTTNYSVLIPVSKGGIIDTPGIREIFIEHKNPEQLGLAFTDFKKYLYKCEFNSCCHIEEQGCAVIRAVEQKKIHYDRYETYKKLYFEMTLFSEEIYGKTYY